MGLTNEEAQKMEIEGLKEQLKKSTDALEIANKEIERIRENESTRLRGELVERGFKPEELAKIPLEDLNLMKVTADRAGVPAKVAGIKRSSDARTITTGLTVGRWDPIKKDWVGAD